MAFWDSITDFVSSDALQGAVNLGSSAFDLYSGYQNLQASQDLMGQAQGALSAQRDLAALEASKYRELYGPIEEERAAYALEDIKALRDLDVARREYGIEQGLRDIDRARDLYRPLEESVVEQLAEGVPAQEFMDVASGDVQRAFGRSQAQQQRQARLAGINPASANFQNIIAQQGTARALGEASARTQARRTAEDLDLARKSQALNYAKGIPLPSTPQFNTQGAMSAASSGYGSVASQAGGLGTQLGKQAGDQFAGAQYSLSNVSDYWGNK